MSNKNHPTEKHQYVLKGTSIWTGFIKKEFDGYTWNYFIRIKRILFWEVWYPIASNLSDLMEDYEEIPSFNANKWHISERTIRVCTFGLGDYKKIEEALNNLAIKRELESERIKAEHYLTMCLEQRQFIEENVPEDLIMERWKDKKDYFTEDMKNQMNAMKQRMNQMMPKRRM